MSILSNATLALKANSAVVNANGLAVGIASASVLNGSSLILPTPTRANFVFEGWFTAASGGTNIGINGASHQLAQQ